VGKHFSFDIVLSYSTIRFQNVEAWGSYRGDSDGGIHPWDSAFSM
jgi:hypothetical protein